MPRITPGKVIWFATMGIVALLGAEAFTRALMPQNRDTVLDILVPDETVGYIYEAGAETYERGREYDVPFVTNSLGLRDREYAAKNGEFRVLLIGNSFAVSHGVDIEGSLSRALEDEIQAVLDARGRNLKVQVVNTANAGYNAWNYWKSYRRWAPVFDPDAVVVGFVAAREHLSDHEDVRFVIRDGLLVKRYREGETPSLPARNPTREARKFLARNSDFYVLMRNYLFYSDFSQRIFGGDEGLGAGSRLVAPFELPAPDRIRDGRARAFEYLARLKSETDADGIPLVVISVPQKEEVLDQAWAVVLDNAETMGAEVDRFLPNNLLREECARLEIPLVDPREGLSLLGEEAFFRHDNHWNAQGIGRTARLAAERWAGDPGSFPAIPQP